jgi:cysteine sulfinate desulfinase/cysteine desulfurase-like protein
MDILMLSSQTHQEMECTQDVIEQIMKIAPEKIVYVNSATQARDLALMDEKYKVTRVRPRYVSANASRRECGSLEKIGLSLE